MKFILADFRYPQDQSDRIWNSSSNPSYTSLQANVTISGHNADSTTPHLRVLQTAFTHPERLEFIHDGSDSGNSEYRLFLYFLELNASVAQGQRVFDIYVNDEIKEPRFDILASGSNYRNASLNVSANGWLNITLVKSSGSAFGPLCNAYEILQVIPWMQETVQTDSKCY